MLAVAVAVADELDDLLEKFSQWKATPKSVIEHPVQHLYPLELTCGMTVAPAALNPTVPAFRPQRNTAVAARAHIQELARMDEEN